MKSSSASASLQFAFEYSFDEQLAGSTVGVVKFKECLQRTRPTWIIRQATLYEEKRGIDLVATSQTGKTFTYEIKSDSRMADTGNIFLETTSVEGEGKPGWIYTCSSDYLVYVDTASETAYIKRMSDIREMFLQEWITRKRHPVMNSDGWVTCGVCIALTEFIARLRPQVIKFN